MTAPMTETGTLTYGLAYEGEEHHDFELRLPTVEDNILALEQVGAASGMRVTVAMLVRSITRIGTIPTEKITFDMLSKGLVDDDYDVLLAAQERLRKKRKGRNGTSSTTAEPSSSSVDTAIPSSPSAQ